MPRKKRKLSQANLGILQKLREDPVFFAKVIMNFEPYRYQKELLQCDSKRIVAVWGRQSGKTTCIAIKVIHYAYTHAGVCIIIVSKGLRQSMIMFSAISNFVLSNQWLRKSIVRYTRTQVHLKNGSSIVALPCSSDGANLRGHTADMIIMDEAAFMNEVVITQVIFPMIATKKHGIAIMLSTPWGRQHIFYRSYTNSKFWVQRVKSRDCPNITDEFLDEQKSLIGDLRFRIEYEAEFLEDQNAFLTQDMIRQCVEVFDSKQLYTEKELTELTGKLAGRFYLGVDLGKRFDHSVVTILKYSPIKVLDDEGNEMAIAPAFRLVYLKQFPLKTRLSKVADHIEWLHTRFNIVAGCIDETGIGQAVVEKLNDMFPSLEGVYFSAQEKQAIAMYLYTRMEQRRVTFPSDQETRYIEDYELTTQMNEQKYYYGRARERVTTEEKGVMLFEHPEGRHDDQLWSFALAVYSTQSRTVSRGIAIK